MVVRQLTAVADDLTGANGVAGRWAGRGVEVSVARRASWLRGEAGCRVLDVETRLLAPGAARAAVVAAWTALGSGGLCFQKIDSTLRGNPGAEIEGLLGATQAPWVALLPAYPALGRQVRGGAVWVHGRRLNHSEYFKDPLSAAKIWDVRRLFKGLGAAHAPLRVVDTGALGLRVWLRRALRDRPRIVTFDCAEERHTMAIAQACLAEGCRHFSGAADLAGALAQRVFGPAARVERPVGLPWILLAGSVSVTTFAQLGAWRAAGGAWSARLRVAPGGRWDVAGAASAIDLRARLLREGALALSSLGSRDALGPWREAQARKGFGPGPCADRAMEELAHWALAVAGGVSHCGWFATGGHTLRALDDAVGFRLFRVAGEVLPEVPLGRAEGPCGSAWLCSKPGGFGNADCFNRFMEADT